MDAVERGASYLAVKPRTEAQVYEYLIGKGYEEAEVREAVDSLKEYHYIDDEEFARMYIRYAQDRGRGLERIKRELSSKGVGRDTIEDVIYQLQQEDALPDEMEMALAVAADILGDIDVSTLDYREKTKLRGRVSRRLASRGFKTDIIYDVLSKTI